MNQGSNMNQGSITITVELTLNDVNVLLAGLSELPAKHSLELIAKLKTAGEAKIAELQQAPLALQTPQEAPLLHEHELQRTPQDE